MLWFAAYQCELYAALVTSGDEASPAVAAKAVKEVDYHRDHASQWVLRLGDGTSASHRRMQEALERVAPYVAELFEDDAVQCRSCGRPEWARCRLPCGTVPLAMSRGWWPRPR